METIKINVNVQIGVTDALYSLLSAFARNSATAPVCNKKEKKPAPGPEPEPEPAQKPTPTPSPEPKELQPVEQQPEETKAEYTEVDVRAAMERTRKRIEGDDYKENTSGEAYKKYHRQLTSWFKNIAAMLGHDKPSALPTSDLRKQFCDKCAELEVDADGNIIISAPF